MMKTTLSCGMLLLAAVYFNAQTTGKVGINTNAPTETLEVNGTLKVDTLPTNGANNAIYNGQNTQNATFTATHMIVSDKNGVLGKHSLGTAGQVLISKGNNGAPEWKDIKEASGVVSKTELKIGTTEIEVSQGSEKEIPGLTYTITVPAEKEKIIMFNIVGYAAPNTFGGTQGVFELFHNGKKISSAYAAGVDAGDRYLRELTGEQRKITTDYLATKLMNTIVLGKIPIPATLMTNVTLKPGEHKFLVKYKSWYGTSKINVDASKIYTGSTPEDNEALLSKMLITIYNVK